MSHFRSFILLFLTSFSYILCDKFYYFAYGSNLIERRLKINCPSAEFYGVAVLPDHRLDFNMFNEMWNGSVATIVEDDEESVTGALWLIDIEDMKHLDKQEGVDKGWYFAKNVSLSTTDGEEIVARTYQEVVNPPKKRPCDDLPYERRPSNTYLEVLIFGAVESTLPSDYIGFLVSFPTNGNHASDEIRKKLGYPFGPKAPTQS